MNSLISELLSGGNQYFTAGAGLFGLGLTTKVTATLARFVTLFARRNFITSVEVSSQDPCYPWLLQLVQKNSQLKQVSLSTSFSDDISNNPKPHFSYHPEPGIHYFWHKSKIFRVERIRTVNQSVYTGMPFESLKLTTFGFDSSFAKDLLDECEQVYKQNSKKPYTTVFTPRGPDWIKLGSEKRQRLLDSIFLANNLKEDIKLDIEGFLASSNWYNSCGVPYKRGYLFHGPPGCGKTSMIMALAGHLNMNVGIINLSEPGLGDERLFYLLATAPKRTILVLEDIDRAFDVSKSEITKSPRYAGMSNLTFSGLLNALDGVASAHGMIMIMTTNNFHQLDKALIRPGRIDKKSYFGYCDEYAGMNMFKHFYINQVNCERTFSKLSNAFLDFMVKNRNSPISQAQLQGHFLIHKDSPRLAVQTLDQLLSSIVVEKLKAASKAEVLN